MSDSILGAEGQPGPAENNPGAAAPNGAAAGTNEFSPWTDQVQKEFLIDDLKGKQNPTEFIKHFMTVRDDLANTKAGLVGYSKLPGEDGTPEEWTAYRAATGIPETAEKYALAFDNLPEGVTIEEEVLKGYQEAAYSANLNQAQAEAMVNFDIQRRGEEAKAEAEAKQEASIEGALLLKERYKDFDVKRVHTMRVVAQIGGEALAKELDETGDGNHPELISALMKMAEAFTEDGIVIGNSAGGNSDPDLDEIYSKSMAHLPSRRG